LRVELYDIYKHFGAVRANDGITLRVEPGSIHGVLGENGAGKSTLMKILSGFQPPDRGEIRLDGRVVTFSSPAAALTHGVGMLHQDPLDFPPLTVLDNFLLGRPTPGLYNRRAARAELTRLGRQLGFDLEPEAPVGNLTVGERQQLEIIRLLSQGAQVLILDEPTTGISASQKTKLFAALRLLAGQGRTILFVSHKLEEVQELCQRVTVLRRGKVAGSLEMPCSTGALVRLMFGQEIASPVPTLSPQPASRLRVEDLTLSEGRLRIAGFSFTAQVGEVIGLAGLEGSGQRLLLRALAGLVRPQGGRIWVDGQELSRASYRDFLAAGIAYLPAARLEEGLVAGLTLTEHVVLARRGREFLVDWPAAEAATRARIAAFRIIGQPATPVQALSGGNQQRALLALLPARCKLLLLEHPTRGLDLESTLWVWEQLWAWRQQGSTILFSSSDLEEIRTYSDRILVFSGGHIAPPLSASQTTVAELGQLIGGLISREPVESVT